jgi:hypothetical protein
MSVLIPFKYVKMIFFPLIIITLQSTTPVLAVGISDLFFLEVLVCVFFLFYTFFGRGGGGLTTILTF